MSAHRMVLCPNTLTHWLPRYNTSVLNDSLSFEGDTFLGQIEVNPESWTQLKGSLQFLIEFWLIVLHCFSTYTGWYCRTFHWLETSVEAPNQSLSLRHELSLSEPVWVIRIITRLTSETVLEEMADTPVFLVIVKHITWCDGLHHVAYLPTLLTQ